MPIETDELRSRRLRNNLAELQAIRPRWQVMAQLLEMLPAPSEAPQRHLRLVQDSEASREPSDN